jgi:hypothetical protein
LYSQGKAIPIPIHDNRDEAATHFKLILSCGSLKAEGFGDGRERMGLDSGNEYSLINSVLHISFVELLKKWIFDILIFDI